MLASVLRSATAVSVSVKIMDAFVEMRRTLAALVPVTQMLKDLQQKQMLDQAKNEERFAQIFTELGKLEIPVQGVFYNGQLWDARAMEKCCQCENVASCQFQFPIEEAA